MNPAQLERRQRLARLEKKLTRIAVALVIAGPVLGMGAGALGAAEVYPYDYALPVAIAAMCAPIGIALLIGAAGGLYIMGGARVAPLGVVFVAGFAALVAGLAGNDALRDLGVVLLAASGAVFYAVGVVSARAPEAVVASWGNVGSIAVGVLVAGVGRAVDAWSVMLFGAMAAGCGIGSVAGRWWVRRAAEIAPSAPPTDARA
jgi:hypothetical protein